MATDWRVKKNYEKGVKVHKKPENEKNQERVTFVLTKRQRSILASYCEKKGISVSDLIRLSLSEYFERVKFDLPDQNCDPNQLKIF